MKYSTVPMSDATVTKSADGWKVSYTGTVTSNSKSGSQKKTVTGQDTLTEVERVQFSDKTLALDIDKTTEPAGAALALYYAGFNQKPDPGILGRWIYEADQAYSHPSSKSASTSVIETVAQKMLDYYAPRGLDNAAFVSLLYHNVLEKTPTPGEVYWFADQLNKHVYSPAHLLAMAAEQSANAADYSDLLLTGVAYTPYTPSKAG